MFRILLSYDCIFFYNINQQFPQFLNQCFGFEKSSVLQGVKRRVGNLHKGPRQRMSGLAPRFSLLARYND